VRSPLPLSGSVFMDFWYQSVIMGLSSVDRVVTPPRAAWRSPRSAEKSGPDEAERITSLDAALLGR